MAMSLGGSKSWFRVDHLHTLASKYRKWMTFVADMLWRQLARISFAQLETTLQLPTSAYSVTLLAFACCSVAAAGGCAAIDLYLLPDWAHSSKPATAACSGWTDVRTDVRQLHRSCSAYCAGSVTKPPANDVSCSSMSVIYYVLIADSGQ